MPGRNALEFYPQSLERGIRSEQALKLAIAEMYLKGVSTRKVVQITEQLCGLDINVVAGLACRCRARDFARPRAAHRARRDAVSDRRCTLREGRRKRHPRQLRFDGSQGRGGASVENGREVSEACSKARRLDGTGAPRRPHGLRSARASSAKASNDKRSGKAESRNQKTDCRRDALPKRSVAAQAGHGDGRRGQRRVGDRKSLSRHGERIEFATSTLLQKNGCFIIRYGSRAIGEGS